MGGGLLNNLFPNKTKGFTLIELLAVIVVLAIIALITVPIVLNIIEKSREGVAVSSARNYIKAVETYVVTSELDKNRLNLDKNNKYNVTKDTIIESKNYIKVNDLVSLKGSKPTGLDDYIILGETKQVTEALLTINGYEILIKDDKVITIIKGEKIAVESISLNKTKETMERGSTFTLEAIFKPENASDQRVKYTSSAEDIVTVSEEGVVTAKNIGTAKVIVTSVDNTSKKAECEITVIASATGLKIEPTETEIVVGEKVTLIGLIEPSDTTTSSLTWTTSDINIASVDENGVVTGISKGEAVITATTVNGISATSKITVKEIYAESIGLNQTSATLENGQTLQLIATITPNETTNKMITWTSSNDNVASVDSNGLVTTRGTGSVVITAKTSNGKTATCNITVIISPSGISLDRTSATIERGSTLQVVATITPNNATNKTITWSTSNANIASVDSNGIVTARGSGNATISATTSNGKTATCNITVIVSPNGISLDRTSASIENGQMIQLYATVSPGDANNKAVTWTSSNTGVATVDGNGLVVARGEGNVVITATTSNGISASANITVTAQTYPLTTQVQVGDYVAYNVSPNSVVCYNSTSLKGWRVLKIENNQIYLVHAGIPECYYHGGNSSSSITAMNNLSQKYINNAYAESAHAMTYDEAYAITGSKDSTSNNLRKTGDVYWLASHFDTNFLYRVVTDGYISANVGQSYGLRPVVVLKSTIKTSGKTIDAVGQEAWNLVGP